MQKPTHRLSRIETQLKREIALILAQEIDDPRIKGVSITEISVSPDLRNAKVFFTFLDQIISETQEIRISQNNDADKNNQCNTINPEKIKKLTQALNHTVSYLKRRVAENLSLRIVPAITFSYDKSLTEALQLVSLIDNLKPSD